MISDGSPGDLLVIIGDNIGDSHPSVFCEMSLCGNQAVVYPLYRFRQNKQLVNAEYLISIRRSILEP